MLAQTRFSKLPVVIASLIAILMGASIVSPSLAHVTRRIRHLYKHLDKRYVERRDLQFVGVNAAGDVYMSSGGVTATRDDTGNYTVRFPSSIRFCGNVATTGEGPRVVEQIGSERYGGPVNEVKIRVWGTSGFENAGFHLVVVC